MLDVFISYSHKDREFVKILDRALRERHRQTWVDWRYIPDGAEWWREIEAGIAGANTFIFVLSPDSLVSKPCNDEIKHALEQGKRFLVLLQRDVDMDKFDEIDRSHPALKASNWLLFREGDDFDASFERLIRSLDTEIRQPPGISVRTIEK